MWIVPNRDGNASRRLIGLLNDRFGSWEFTGAGRSVLLVHNIDQSVHHRQGSRIC